MAAGVLVRFHLLTTINRAEVNAFLREATKSVFLPWYRKGWWYDIMSDVFPEYETERRAEFYIWRYREYY